MAGKDVLELPWAPARNCPFFCRGNRFEGSMNLPGMSLMFLVGSAGSHSRAGRRIPRPMMVVMAAAEFKLCLSPEPSALILTFPDSQSLR
jgi:hypothetical protein